MVTLRVLRVYAFGALPPPVRDPLGDADLGIKTSLEFKYRHFMSTLGRWFALTRSVFITREARGRQWLGTARNR